jgi:protein-disulfide isomerase
MNKKMIVLTSILIMSSIFTLGVFIVNKKTADQAIQSANQDSAYLERSYSVTLGSPEAKVTLVEFFDPACEACRAFYTFVKQLMNEHPGQIKLVMRYAPFHEGADYYVRILEASRQQDKYWETLEILYQSQHYWASHHQAKPDLAWEVIKNTSLNINQLKEDMKDSQLDMILSQDPADVASLKISKTPSFYVNQKPLVQFGYKQLRDLVETEIAAMY